MRLYVFACPFLLALIACDRSAPQEPAAPSGRAKIEGGRLVILGFDGVDPRRVDTLIAAGALPNVKALGERGHRGSLRSTNPPQSPVAWAAFATGLHEGEHGIFDFVGRSAATYLPEISTTRVTHAEVHGDEVTPAHAENLRRGEAFWDVLARAGVPVRALRVPYNFPLPSDGATALSGLGTPDVRGINSSFTSLTTDAEAAAGPSPAGGQLAVLEALGGEAYRAMIEGPALRVDGKRQKTYAPVLVRRDGDKVRVEAGGVSQTLGQSETGAYVSLEFVPAQALRVRAVTRFTVRKLSPPELYVEPLSIVPTAPYLEVAKPRAFGAGLWRDFGPFKTVGWIDDTSALGAGVMDEAQFLREAFATMRLEEQLLLAALAERTERVLLSVFVSPDRIGHMFYRYLDGYAAPGDDPAFARALDDSYLEMDRIVGAAAKALTPDDVLLVVSDHGFASFRRGLNLNTWLAQRGYLKLRPGVKEPRDFFADVDWSKSKAYAMGTGSIYLNIRGREAQGSVAPGEAGKLAKLIAKGLLGVREGQTQVVTGTFLGDDIYQGPERQAAPDVRVALADGYRASWATSLGGIPKELFEQNTKKWSGDHASSLPQDVPGFILCNRPLLVSDPGIVDVAPTAYGFAKVAPKVVLAGRRLF